MANKLASRQLTVARNETIDLNRLSTFVRVVEDGSFTAAAKRLGIPKSSVSRSVTALERSLGVRLMQRTTRALSLTDAGRTYFQQVRPALASLSDSSASVSALGSEVRGRVRVVSAAATEQLLARFVADFSRQHPGVQIETSFTNRHVDLVAEGFDIAIHCGEPPNGTVVARKLASASAGLFASPKYLRRRGTPKTLDDLKRHDCIAVGAPSGRVTWMLTGPSGERESVELDCTLATDHPTFAMHAVVAGAGIALIPSMHADRLPDLFARVLPEYSRTDGALYLLSPSRAFEPRAVTAFKNGLQQMLSGLDHAQCTQVHRRTFGKK
jgi:DNA-binding transcriptional LysR family regulator